MAKSVYKALADPTRRKILQLLRERDMTAGELADQFNFAKPTLSRHFSVLREAELIQGNKQGNHIYYRLNVFPIEILPLRQRPNDIIPLVQHFTQRFTTKFIFELFKNCCSQFFSVQKEQN